LAGATVTLAGNAIQRMGIRVEGEARFAQRVQQRWDRFFTAAFGK